MPADCGILESVKLENFMCHDNFTFELGPLINFICGKNGSGKSAILTAIVICLGGKASSTNRAAALKDFIQAGKDYATITCNIKNQGEGAYLPDEYGNTIQVERHWTKSSSSFKIKNARGRIISTKKSDLEDICDHFALQMDNPLNVLSQDNARQFISTSSASEKYKFFVRGVQLEQLDQDYRLIEEQLDNIEVKIEAKRPDIKILEQRKQRAKEKLDLSRKHDGTREKLRDYRRQLVWIQVYDQESRRDALVQEIEEASQRIAQVETKVNQLDVAYQEAERGAEHAKEVSQQAENEVRQAKDEKSELSAKRDEVREEVTKAQTEQRSIKGTVKSTNAAIVAAQKKIAEEEQRLAALNGGGAAARLQDLEEAKETLQEAREALSVHKATKAQLDKDVTDSKDDTERTPDLIKAKEEEIKRQEGHVAAMSRNKNGQDTAFHRSMPNLLAAIQRERGFRQRPIGPMGKHIKLLRPEWAQILEKSFGQNLNGFLVTSKDDERLLNNIIKRLSIEGVPTVIGNDQPIDTRRHEPEESFLTWDRALEIDNDAVRKQFVIANGIEQTILIEDLEEGRRTMFDHGRLSNVKRCFCMNPNNKRQGIMLSYVGNNPSQDPIHEFVGVLRMKTDIDAQIRIQQDVLTDMRSEKLRLSQGHTAAVNRNEKAKQALVRYNQLERDLVIAFQKAQDQVEAVQEAIKEDNVESGKLDFLRRELADLEEQNALNDENYQDAYTAYTAKVEQLSTAQELVDDCDPKITSLEAAAQTAKVEAQDQDKKRARLLGDKNDAIARIEDGKKDRQKLEDEREAIMNTIEEFSRQASEICGRINIDAGETMDTLQRKYTRLQEELQKYQQQVGSSREEIAAKAAETSEAYKKGLQDLRDLESLSMKLKASLIERRERWKKFRSLISVRAKAQFTYLLSERSFRGKLITDHKQKLLELSVEPDITKRNGSGRGARTLSGGEKSFSQICLLLAIWEAMGSPIRCLDEFDVFMDAVNRNMSVNMLVEAARQSVGRQFVLISPGTKSDIKRAADVNVTEYVKFTVAWSFTDFV